MKGIQSIFNTKKALYMKLSVKGMLNSHIMHNKMEGSGICHTMEFATYLNLRKSVLSLIAALSIEEGYKVKELLAGPDLTNQIVWNTDKVQAR